VVRSLSSLGPALAGRPPHFQGVGRIADQADSRASGLSPWCQWRPAERSPESARFARHVTGYGRGGLVVTESWVALPCAVRPARVPLAMTTGAR
jgi:hypothetical protein